MAIYTDTGRATIHESISPSDTASLLQPDGVPKYRALKVTAAGNVSITDTQDTTIIYPVEAGDVLQFGPKRVNNTDTTATVVGWY